MKRILITAATEKEIDIDPSAADRHTLETGTTVCRRMSHPRATWSSLSVKA